MLIEPINFRQIDIHNPDKVILFRHFVEYIVRACYLKNNGENDLAKVIEKTILNKIKPVYDKKVLKGNNVSDDDV